MKKHDRRQFAPTDERMSSGGIKATTFRKAQRLKRELNLNINTNPPLLIRIVSGMYGRIRSTDL